MEYMRKEISDPKILYLVKTLSRTRRKDYENYVINAIWQRLDNCDIEIVSQQYIEDRTKSRGRSHYFIDLYFPALNVGIECDEAYHSGQTQSDHEREASIFDVLYMINEENYVPKHVDVTRSFEDVQDQINNVVRCIKDRINEVNPPKWKIETPEEYYSSKSMINISDKKGFRTISKTCNVLFNAGRSESSKGASRSYFSLPNFKGTQLENYKLWFPHLAVEVVDDDGNKRTIAATRAGWNNQLCNDGRTILERNENNISYKQDGKKRIVFLKYKDPLGFNEYKFVGVFEFLKKVKDTVHFTRVSKSCIMIK